MRSGWLWGSLYLAAYGGWGWWFRSRVDAWARRTLGKRLGVEVIWLRATRFPLEIWVWGLAGLRHGRNRLDSHIALASVALCLAGAFMPTAALCLLLHWRPSDELGAALYLTTPLILPVFVASHLKWRASDSPSTAQRATAGRDSGAPPSEPPGRLDSSKGA